MDEASKQSGRARLLVTLGVLAWLIFAGGAAYYFLIVAPSDSSPTPVASAPSSPEAPVEEANNQPSASSVDIPGGASLDMSDEAEDALVNIGRRILEGDEEEEPAPTPPPASVDARPSHTADEAAGWTKAVIPVGAFFLSLFSSLTSFYFALSAHRRAERARASSA